ncbi:MAG: carboxypeptidase M32 [Clostridiales bacterium]|nr:carboxypeptidase M32 [Clostridiales bacterium]
MQEAFSELLTYYQTIYDLGKAAAVLNWDRETYMPRGGTRARADQLSTLARLIHERVTSPKMGELLEKVLPWAREQGEDSFEYGVVRLLKRRYDRQVKVPADLVEAMSRAASKGHETWLLARKEKNFAPFAPALEELVRLRKDYADALGWEERRYDALLDQVEPGITSRWLDQFFAELREGLVPLVQAVSERRDRVKDDVLHQHWPEDKQWQLTLQAVEAIGYDLSRGRQDRSVHPFTTAFSPDDVRITTRVDEHFFSAAFFASLHEAGHALYGQGIPQKFYRTPLDGGSSGGVHESQSRMWENVVGRSLAFWEFFFPKLKEMFPSQTEGVTVEDWYRAVNKSQPSLIRVEADELTYNLHIMVRYELEQDLFADRLQVKDLPEAWNEKMKSYLGITPPDDLEGVLQDIHWSGGGFGSFPSYALGNVIAGQIWETVKEAQPGIEEEMRRGLFGTLLQWTREKIHRHGAQYDPLDLVQRATGKPLSTEPYLSYIRQKFSHLYGL